MVVDVGWLRFWGLRCPAASGGAVEREELPLREEQVGRGRRIFLGRSFVARAEVELRGRGVDGEGVIARAGEGERRGEEVMGQGNPWAQLHCH